MTIQTAYERTNRQYMDHVFAAYGSDDRGCAFPSRDRCPRGQQLWDDTVELWERTREGRGE